MEIDDDIAEAAPAVCAACGATAPRGDMFGVEPDLRCEDCAAGVRKRMHVRFKPVAKDYLPRATAACVALAAALFIASNLIWPRFAETPQPAWLQVLYQGWGVWLGHVWKHLTSMFLHYGWIHILFNGFVLYGIGRIFESRYGTGAFLAVLLLTGVAGQAAEFMAHEAQAAGLSGGLLGLIGFLIARRREDPVAGAVMNDGNVRFVLIYVVACVLATMAGLINIANWAHGVGLAMGWLFGRASLDDRRQMLLPFVAVACLVIVVLSVFVAFGDTDTNQGPMSRMDARTLYIEQNR